MLKPLCVRSLCALAFLVASPVAQQQKVLPRGMDFVEGPLVYTYPFGRQDGAIQLLYDSNQVTLSQGVVTGIRFRQSEVTAAQIHPGYTKGYKVTAYTVLTNAQSMVADLAQNRGAAVGTVVFQGSLVLPPVQVLTNVPAAFGIHIPFTTVYPYDGSQGNLLLLIETDDQLAVPSGSYRIDAVNFAFTAVTGLSSNLDSQGCIVNGNSMSLFVDPLAATVGGSITHAITASQNGAFPLVASVVGFGVQPVDLTTLGMPGCTSWPASPLARFVFENAAGGYTPLVWSLPNAPWLEGVALASQLLGIAPSGQLVDSATSNGVGTRIGGVAGPTRNMGMSFRSVATGPWSMGQNGVFIAVAALEGVFP